MIAHSLNSSSDIHNRARNHGSRSTSGASAFRITPRKKPVAEIGDKDFPRTRADEVRPDMKRRWHALEVVLHLSEDQSYFLSKHR